MATEQRLIDANEPLKQLSSYMEKLHCLDDYRDGVYRGMEIAESYIKNAPTVDAVEVVRCKDCIKCEKAIHAHVGMVFKCTLFNPKDVRRYKNPDDFCSCGERRTDHV